jgi:hypothetical protein
MIAEQTYGAHSAQAEMRLIVNGASISIAPSQYELMSQKQPTAIAATAQKPIRPR